MRNKRFIITMRELKKICREKKKELLESEVPERKVDDINISIPIKCIEDWQYIVRKETTCNHGGMNNE